MGHLMVDGDGVGPPSARTAHMEVSPMEGGYVNVMGGGLEVEVEESLIVQVGQMVFALAVLVVAGALKGVI
jgi:hypothetical protein